MPRPFDDADAWRRLLPSPRQKAATKFGTLTSRAIAAGRSRQLLLSGNALLTPRSPREIPRQPERFSIDRRRRRLAARQAFRASAYTLARVRMD